MLGGMQLSVDGEARELHDQMTYKGVLVEDIPNLAWMFGYTNAPWTLKSDIAGDYLCRLFRHMDDNGYAVATARDVEDCALDDGMLDRCSPVTCSAPRTSCRGRGPSCRGRC